MGFPSGSLIKNLPASGGDLEDIGDLGSFPGPGGCPGRRNSNPLQYSCLGNPMDRGDGRLQSMRSRRVRHNLTTEHKHNWFLMEYRTAVYVLFVALHHNSELNVLIIYDNLLPPNSTSRLLTDFPGREWHHCMLFSHQVTFDSSRPYGLQHTRPPCPSSSPQVWSGCIINNDNFYPLSF